MTASAVHRNPCCRAAALAPSESAGHRPAAVAGGERLLRCHCRARYVSGPREVYRRFTRVGRTRADGPERRTVPTRPGSPGTGRRGAAGRHSRSRGRVGAADIAWALRRNRAYGSPVNFESSPWSGLFRPAAGQVPAGRWSDAGLIVPDRSLPAARLGMVPVETPPVWFDRYVKAYVTAGDYLTGAVAARGLPFDPVPLIRQPAAAASPRGVPAGPGGAQPRRAPP